FRVLVVPAESTRRPLHGLPWQGTVTTTEGRQVRLYSRALTQEGKIFGVVQVGASLSEVNTSLHEVGIDLLFTAPVVLFLSALVSFWLSSRAFAPIERVIRTARAIQGGDLQQ